MIAQVKKIAKYIYRKINANTNRNSMKTKKTKTNAVNFEYLVLETEDFTANQNDTSLKIFPPIEKGSRGNSDDGRLFKDLSGRWTRGSMAHFNFEGINVEIYAVEEPDNPAMLVSFPPAVILPCEKTNGISISRLPMAIDIVKTRLKRKAGINCNLKNAIVSKMFLQKTIALPYDSTPVFETISNLKNPCFMGMHIKYPKNIFWKNLFSEIAVYEVPLDLANDHRSVKGAKSAVRFELRMQDYKSIEKYFNTNIVGGLTQRDVDKLFFNMVGLPFHECANFTAGKESMEIYEALSLEMLPDEK